MLVEIAIADAYGAGFEFADPSQGRPNDASFYVRNPAYHKLHPGMYTDDGQMSLAVAESLLEGDTTREGFARSFVRAFQRDRRDGYARRFQEFLEGVSDADDFLTRIVADSDRSGAAMRAATIGLLPDVSEVVRVATIQARITHDTHNGVLAAVGAALMAHHRAYDLGARRTLPAFLDEYAPGLAWDAPYRGRTKAAGEQIVRAALGILIDATSLTDVLIRTVAQGGDTDTVAAIAMGAACLDRNIPKNLPETLYANLESGPFGIAYLADVDVRLAERFGLPRVAGQAERAARRF